MASSVFWVKETYFWSLVFPKSLFFDKDGFCFVFVFLILSSNSSAWGF